MLKLRTASRRFLPLAFFVLFLCQSLYALPTGFIEQTVGSGWNQVVGLTFADDGRMFVWERGGRIWIYENGAKQLFLDISDEVGGWRDYGLLGVALHPNFYNTGHVYLLYVVDRHHLLYAGTPSYNPNTDEYFAATIGRITRYTANAADGYRSIDYSSRKVLLGETASTGFPIMHQSHGTGQIVVGTDGTLLAACGDGASYSATDTGGNVGGTYASQALADGIISPKEDIGAYRCQMVDSLSGKVVRIDAETGDGLPSNPFYDASAPRAARSRCWALGLRNPCRMMLRPGTGSHRIEDGDPGVLYVGDVGWTRWEDLHVIDGPGLNCGWPVYEGMEVHTGYAGRNIPNLDAPNPLFGVGGCTQEYFYFNQLIIQDTLATPSFPNPCNGSQQIPSSIPTFVHSRPAIDWRHGSGPARTKIYSGNNAAVINIGANGSPVAGPQFGGNAAIGGCWYQGSDFPAQYHNTSFHADYSAQWIRNFVFDANNNPVEVRNFTSGKRFVAVATHPIDGGLYYVQWPNNVWKVSYQPSGNQPPVAVASADQTYDASSSLTAQFTGSASTDPEGQPLSYDWDFGDGTPNSQSADPSHTFNAPSGVPTPYTVTLTVTDAGGLTSQATITVSVNNTPPVVDITSIADGDLYPMSGDTIFPLEANRSDAEHATSQLTCEWQTILHHNNHTHSEPVDTNCSTTTVISPAGCTDEIYFYAITCTVTDPAGLSATDEVRIYPNCAGANSPPIALNDVAVAPRSTAISVAVLANDVDVDGSLNPGSVQVTRAPLSGTAVPNASGLVTYTHDGSAGSSDSFTYTVRDNSGAVSGEAEVVISIVDGTPNLLVAYGFEETGGTAYDTSGSANDGTLENGVARAGGYFGDGIQADGNSGNINLGPLDVPGNALTAMLWFKADDFGVSDARLLSKSTSQSGNDHFLMLSTINSSGMRLRLRLKTDGSGTQTLIGTGATIQAGSWVHVAATYDGTRSRLFQNGVEIGSIAQTGNITQNPGVDMWLCDNPGSAQDQVFDGMVDEFRLFDRALSASEIQSLMATPIGALVDNQPPTVPQGLSGNAMSSMHVALSWSPSTDNISVAGYRVRRNGTEIGTVTTTSLMDQGLTQNTAYSYTVEAFDTSGNDSGESDAVVVQTPILDTTPPSQPQNVLASALTHSSIEIQWDASTDNVAVTGYHIYRDGTEVADIAATTYVDSGLSPLTTYTYTIVAHDAEHNHSPASDPPASAQTLERVGDPDLVAGYGFEESGDITILDSSLNGNHGTLAGGAGREPSGYFGEAIECFGNGARADLGGLDVNGSELTIMAWFYADDFGISDARIISKTTSSAAQDHYWMISTINSDGMKLRFRLKTTNGGTSTLIGTAAIATGTWIHAAVVYDGAAMRIYQNGVLVGTLAKTGGLVTNPAVDASIGANPNGNQGFDGLIDEVQIHQRALPEAEIVQKMNQAIGDPPVDDQSPSVPSAVVATAISSSQIRIDWTASVDNFAVAGYRVFRGGVDVGTTSSTSFIDTGLTPETIYSYTVLAYDAAGNNSAQSSPAASAQTLVVEAEVGLVAAYSCDEGSGSTLGDESGNGSDGTLQSGAAWNGSGYFGASAEFNGSSSRVDLGGLDVSGNAITLMAWIRPDDFGTRDGRIISKATGQNEQDHYWMLSTIRSGSSYRLRFRLKTSSGGTKTLVASSGNLSAGQWAHVAATYNGSSMTVYVNGSAVGSTSKSGNISTSGSVAVWIGNNPVQQKPFDGRIDEVRIYERSLTAAEIGQKMGQAVAP